MWDHQWTNQSFLPSGTYSSKSGEQTINITNVQITCLEKVLWRKSRAEGHQECVDGRKQGATSTGWGRPRSPNVEGACTQESQSTGNVVRFSFLEIMCTHSHTRNETHKTNKARHKLLHVGGRKIWVGLSALSASVILVPSKQQVSWGKKFRNQKGKEELGCTEIHPTVRSCFSNSVLHLQELFVLHTSLEVWCPQQCFNSISSVPGTKISQIMWTVNQHSALSKVI